MKFRVLALAAALAVSPTAFADAEPWIHVRVENPNADERVSVNLPLSLASAAARAIDQSSLSEDLRIEFDEEGLSVEELRTLWDEVRDVPDATLVTVHSRSESVAVRKSGDWLLVEVDEHGDRGTRVDVRIPTSVVEALLADPARLDFEGAILALADVTSGPVVSVRDGDETVDIWIDEQAESSAPARAGR